MYSFHIKTHDFHQIVDNCETNNALPTTRILKFMVSLFIIQLAEEFTFINNYLFKKKAIS